MYSRPQIDLPTYRDDAGTPIPYGHRWPDSPPEDSYSRTSNLDRFAPLHAVGAGLIDWLAAEFDVTVTEGAPPALSHERDDIVRSVRIDPSDPMAAPLGFVFTSFPSVFLRAGVLHQSVAPVCGCDACDEEWESSADELEQLVIAVTSGRFAERVRGREVAYLARSDGGGRSGMEHESSVDPARLDAARERLRTLEKLTPIRLDPIDRADRHAFTPWRAWPPRTRD